MKPPTCKGYFICFSVLGAYSLKLGAGDLGKYSMWQLQRATVILVNHQIGGGGDLVTLCLIKITLIPVW